VIIKWINENAAWFFTNGNKQNKIMNTNFEKHIGQELPQAMLDYLEAHTTEELIRQAEKLKFDSWCPLALENDSPELRKELKEASELLFKYVDFK